jgi:hypothetical protein
MINEVNRVHRFAAMVQLCMFRGTMVSFVEFKVSIHVKEKKRKEREMYSPTVIHSSPS